MAIMIPTDPYEYTEASMEGKIFNKLKEMPCELADKENDYYVFHSYKINKVDAGTLERREIDFVIFHPEKGILCLECKNGHVINENRVWYFAKIEDGVLKVKKNNRKDCEMPHGGPFRQAEKEKEALLKCISNEKIPLCGYPDKKLKDHCKFIFGVCFPKINSSGKKFKLENRLEEVKFEEFLKCEQEGALVIYGKDLRTPGALKKKLDNIFEINIKDANGETIYTGINGQRLQNEDIQNLFEQVLCPNFNIVAIFDSNTDMMKYIRMNEDQLRVLELLTTMREMAVSGMAGTGKTVLAQCLARKKARTEVRRNKFENVLFLCRSRFQRQELEKNPLNKKIYFRDIDWLLKIKPVNKEDYYKTLCKRIWLEEGKHGKPGNFVIDTFIIDEAQDFCAGEVYDCLKALYEAIEPDREGGGPLRQKFQQRIGELKRAFYLFYDEFQGDSESKILEFAQKIKNHIELNKNCRNTVNITETLLRPLVKIPSDYCQRKDRGEKVKIDFYSDDNEFCLRLDRILRKYKLQPDDTVILTLNDESIAEAGEDKGSILLHFKRRLVDENGQAAFQDNSAAGKTKEVYYKLGDTSFLFIGWKNFQGLERRNIIIVDFDQEMFFRPENESYAKRFYVCMTRAQEAVYILTQNVADRIPTLRAVIEDTLIEMVDLNIVLEECEEEFDGACEEIDGTWYSHVDAGFTERIERACQEDKNFMYNLGNAIKECCGLKEFTKKTKGVPENILREYYDLWVRKVELEEDIANKEKWLERVQKEASENLEGDFVKEYKDIVALNPRAAICAALKAESINDKDIVINNAFKKLAEIGQEVRALRQNEEGFHKYIVMMILVWKYMEAIFLSFTDSSFSVLDEHDKAPDNFDLNQIEKILQKNGYYSNDWEPVSMQNMGSFKSILEELYDYQSKGVCLQALWEGYRTVDNWKMKIEDVKERDGELELETPLHLPLEFWENFKKFTTDFLERHIEEIKENVNNGHIEEINEPLLPLSPETFWRKFGLFENNYLEQNKKNEAPEGMLGVANNTELKNQLDSLEQKALQCYLEADKIWSEFCSDPKRQIDWEEMSDERRFYGHLTEEKSFDSNFTTYYLDNIKYIKNENLYSENSEVSE